MASSPAPTLRLERQLLRAGAAAVASVDEAGRGAVCGPVSVGAVLVAPHCRPAPAGVRDSKLLSPLQRHALVPLIRSWAPSSVGMASAAEVDDLGIMGALRLAGLRAVRALPAGVAVVLLDGDVDYLGRPQPSLFGDEADGLDVPVVTRVRADRDSSAVAAASILAKEARDDVMRALDGRFPEYGLARNMGYASKEHREALLRLGPCAEHRTSWDLPGCTP